MLAGATRGQQVEHEERVGASLLEPGRALDGVAPDAQVRHDRPTLLRHPRLVDARDLEPVEVGGGGQDLADGDHAGPADAGDEQRRALAGSRRVRASDRGVGAGLPAGRAAASGGASQSRTPGSRPRCSSCRGCTSPGGCGSCARTACRPGARSGSCETSPQSPQPSQTASLIITRVRGRRPRGRACARGGARRRRPGRRSAR